MREQKTSATEQVSAKPINGFDVIDFAIARSIGKQEREVFNRAEKRKTTREAKKALHSGQEISYTNHS